MAGDPLVQSLPDLVLLVRRDGVVLAQGGGHDVRELRSEGDCIGRPLDALYDESTAALLKQLVRRAIAQRANAEATLRRGAQNYDVRAYARGPDRAICVVRRAAWDTEQDGLDSTGDRPRPQLDRRGFLRRFRESLSLAALQEKPLAVAVIQVDGIPEIARVITTRVSEQVMSTAIVRLSARFAQRPDGQPSWYLGQLGENLLALVIESAHRDAIEALLGEVCASLREPISAGDAEFHLTPYAGVGVLGQDAASPKSLLDHARAAAAEARRSGIDRVCFFTDSLRLKTLARLDITRELREAMANGDIRLRYVARCDLATGRLVTHVGYLRWQHPLRGEIRPAEFLRVAEATGLAVKLSRLALARLGEDFARLREQSGEDVHISFGALRHHILHEEFSDDLETVLKEAAVPPERLELRIAEKAFVARDPGHFNALARLGVRLVVDEVARGMGSLRQLARASIWGLQLDRAWTTALREDEVARKVCRAGISMAQALGLVPIAMGVDDGHQRDALLTLGCQYGTGDLYRDAVSDITSPERASASA